MYRSVQIPRIARDLMSTNVYAEVRGKYARAPAVNYRPVSCRNNAPVTFFKDEGKEQESGGKHMTVIERRRRLRKRISSQEPLQEPLQDPEVVDKDIKELTRLLKIERLKRLIVQKRLETQEF